MIIPSKQNRTIEVNVNGGEYSSYISVLSKNLIKLDCHTVKADSIIITFNEDIINIID
jgi:hypothetical protein